MVRMGTVADGKKFRKRKLARLSTKSGSGEAQTPVTTEILIILTVPTIVKIQQQQFPYITKLKK